MDSELFSLSFFPHQPLSLDSPPPNSLLLISLLRLGGKPCVEIQGKSGYDSPSCFPSGSKRGGIQGYGLITNQFIHENVRSQPSKTLWYQSSGVEISGGHSATNRRAVRVTDSIYSSFYSRTLLSAATYFWSEC